MCYVTQCCFIFQKFASSFPILKRCAVSCPLSSVTRDACLQVCTYKLPVTHTFSFHELKIMNLHFFLNVRNHWEIILIRLANYSKWSVNYSSVIKMFYKSNSEIENFYFLFLSEIKEVYFQV